MAERKETIKKVPARKEHSELSTALSVSDLGLPKVQVSSRTFSLWIRALLQNWRQGTVACKGRADVAKSRKRPWKQKGTGRARVSSARSPLWRGGGIIFGPQPRTRMLKVPVQTKHLVLAQLMYNLAEAGRLRILDFAPEQKIPKTSIAWQALKGAGLHENITLLIVHDDIMVQTSFANIPTVQILLFDQLNAFHLAGRDQVVVLRKDLERFKEMVSRWI